MKVALVHFHLKTGGVTSVIRDQILALQDLGFEFLVLTGSMPDGPFPAQTIHIPMLAYDQDLPENPEPESIAAGIKAAIFSKWPLGADVLHVHNPTLAKNRCLQAVLKILQGQGQRILCQIHDFAEDGRPDVYFTEPYLGDCHYATVNPRDRQLLIRAGLKPEACHLLPNAVTLPGPDQNFHECPNGPILYPVRAIRRKNIGEAILLTLFFNPAAGLSITLPPNSPLDLEHYRRWRGFVDRFGLKVSFETGLETDFSALMANCRFVLTTSITEGFGFSFLEAWTAGKALWGRMLPNVGKAFSRKGLRLDHLYRQMKVPLAWLDEHALSRQWQNAMRAAAQRFGLDVSRSRIVSAWRRLCTGGYIDFGLLSESHQRRIIRLLINSCETRNQLIAANPYLANPGPPPSGPLIVGNRAAVARNFNQERNAQRLKAVYDLVMRTAVHHGIDKRIIATAFLTPRHFSLLKWGG